MKEVVDKCSTKGCSVDIGTVIDNDNCTHIISRFFKETEAAEAYMSALRELAFVASTTKEGVVISYSIKKAEEEVLLEASFTFSCQAELIIFELSLRTLN